jgi:L-rhamnose-H+ transport protein
MGGVDMTNSVVIGTFIVIFGAAMQGSFVVPMKFTRKWAWENIWLIYSMLGLVLVPCAVALGTVPDLGLVYRSVSTSAFLSILVFGFAWGLGNVLFGLAVATAGMALSFSVVSGMSAALGSLIPLFVLNRERLTQPSGALVISGVVMALIGVGIIGAAGRRREAKAKSGAAQIPITRGLLLAIGSGLLAPTLNFSFAFGKEIVGEAVRHGASETSGADAIWAVCLAGGCLSNAGYAVLRLIRNRTWVNFSSAPCSPWLLSALMGLLFTGGLLLYGRGAAMLGGLGAAAGWPVFQATMIITSTCLGALTGEWRGADSRFVRATIAGILILITAIVVLSLGNRM